MFRILTFAVAALACASLATPALSLSDQKLLDLLDQADDARSQERWTEAMSLYQQALPQLRSREDAERRLSVLYNFGTIERLMAKGTEAEQHLREALPLGVEVYGEKSRYVGRVLTELAMISLDQRKLDQAEHEAGDALSMLERKVGLAHPETMRALDVLAELSGMTEKWAQAEPLMKRQLAYYRANAQFVDYVPAVECNLGVALFRQQKFNEALPLLQSGYADRSKPIKALPPQWMATVQRARAGNFAACAYDLAIALALLDRYDESIEPLRVALAFYENDSQAPGKTLAGVQSHLADALMKEAAKVNPYDETLLGEAAVLAQQGLSRRLQLFDKEDERVAESSHTLGSVLYMQGKMGEAEPHLIRASLIFQKLATPGAYYVTQHNAIRTLIDLASTLQAQQKWAEARITLIEARSRLKTVKDPETGLLAMVERMLALSEQRGG